MSTVQGPLIRLILTVAHMMSGHVLWRAGTSAVIQHDGKLAPFIPSSTVQDKSTR